MKSCIIVAIEQTLLTLAILAAITFLFNCATGPTAYNGPPGLLPFIQVRERRQLDSVDPLHPKWIASRTGEVVNPSAAPMRVTVRCSKTIVEVSLPPMTSELFVLQPSEGICSVFLATRRPTEP